MTVTVNGPVLVLAVVEILSVEVVGPFAGGFTLLGLTLQVAVSGQPDRVNATVPVNPLNDVVVTVELPALPCVIVSDDAGLADKREIGCRGPRLDAAAAIGVQPILLDQVIVAAEGHVATMPPLDAVDSAPKFQAHMSAFSCAVCIVYQAFKFGSLMRFLQLMRHHRDHGVDRAGRLLGLLPDCTGAAAETAVPALPTNAYLMLAPLMVPYVCQPQYWERNPEVSPMSGAVSTKYTPLVSVGRASEVRAFETMLAMLESFNKFPK